MEASTGSETKEDAQLGVSFKTAWTLFGILCAVSLGIWWKTLGATFLLAIQGDAYTQVLFAIPISALLLAVKFPKENPTPSPAKLPGVVLLLLSAAVGVFAFGAKRQGLLADDTALAVEALALVCWWIGAFFFSFGTQITRKCLFPLLFLLWFVPIPRVLVDGIVTILQRGTASLTHGMLAVVGVRVKQHGDLLSLPGLTIEVAAECSSIRSSLLLVMSSTVLAYLLVRSAWGRISVILLAGPLAVFKNAVRVFTLSVLSAYVNPEIMNSRLHRQGGVIFLAIALFLLLAVVWFIRKIEARRTRPAFPDGTQASVGITHVTQRPLG